MTTPASPTPSLLSDAEWQQLSGKTQGYVLASYELIAKADVYLADGDLRQASEKGWGAAALIVKAIAENWKAYGAMHGSHWHLAAMVKGLAGLDPQSGIDRAFQDVQDLHGNFYENDLALSTISLHLGQVRRFIGAMIPWLRHPTPPQDIRRFYQRRRPSNQR